MGAAPSPKFRLSLLGRFALSGPDGLIDLPNKKLACLLAYLACTAPTPQPREKLATLLWGSHFDAQARQNLRQALFRLRRVLGDEALISHGESVSLLPDAIACDVAEFEALVGDRSHGALNGATGLYKGCLLPDIEIPEEAWTEWLAAERQRLEGIALAAMVKLAEQELEAGNNEPALSAANRAIAVSGLREDAHRLVMRALAAGGRRADALQHYEDLTVLLKRELGVEPDPATRALAAELRRSQTAQPRAGAASGLAFAPDATTQPQSIPLPLPDRPSIAVLPFTNMSGDPEQEYFADGMVDDIISGLSRFRWLFVIARNSSFTYKGRALDVKQVGRELGVRYLLEGSVRKSANRIRIAGQLIDTSSGTHLWADRFEGALEDVFELQDKVTASVVGAIAPRLQQAEIERARRKPTESLGAYDLFLRGRANFYKWTREANKEALRLYYKAIELDPDSCAAYASAALCFCARKAFGLVTKQDVAEARRLALCAVQLGKDDSTAFSSAGFVLAYVAGELDDGAAFLDRALLMNPNSASAWYFSGWVQVYLGEADRAIESFAHAMRLNPIDPGLSGMQQGTACAHFFAGRYDEAVKWAKMALRELPDSRSALRIGIASCALAGRDDEAKRLMARLLAIGPELTISSLLQNLGPYRHPEHPAKFAEALRKAGLPG